MNRHLGILKVNEDTLRQALKLPDNVEIFGAFVDPHIDPVGISLKLRCPDFPDLEIGRVVPEVKAAYITKHTKVNDELTVDTTSFEGWRFRG
jgi:hypothetical protein